ncbi:enoyl-CoA hydratase/isomerase family protein [Flammeovirga pectinis]|uniref:Enoyl-CoA hydratase/isomerase family protein n=1 Tax=Flammeovirga pectinis TaxID=2494373 RepID=A0A3Q9FLK7_9BACT|nr:enoyl-CoA hydratase-related protein [Flammeovirga pectinis]AZQ60978.1 enoyl-CoA hydratase/isomerase family protein [Flammeovirga pectinis]
MLDNSLLIFIKKQRIAYITLNRPEKRNALNADLVAELSKVLNEIENDTEVSAVVLKGAGKAFCAGADLQYIQNLQNFSFEENVNDSNALKELFYKIYTFPKIIIASVHGAAIAGGCGLATLCDFSFAANNTKFCYSEVKIGFIPAIVSIFLARKIGEGKAKQLLLSAQTITADKALEYGLINGITTEANLEEEVESFALKLISETSLEAKMNTKKLLNSTWHLPIEEALNIAVKENAKARESADCKKGISSFLNKEKISW